MINVLASIGLAVVDRLNDGPQKRAEAKEAEENRKRNLFIENHALSCRRCKGMAKPILGTKNRYRCACGNQFASAYHGGY